MNGIFFVRGVECTGSEERGLVDALTLAHDGLRWLFMASVRTTSTTA